MAVSGEGNEAAPKAPSWLQVAVANAGMVRAATAISWAWCWGITRADIGHDPTVEEVAEWWGASVRTAYRDYANFSPVLKGALALAQRRAPWGMHRLGLAA